MKLICTLFIQEQCEFRIVNWGVHKSQSHRQSHFPPFLSLVGAQVSLVKTWMVTKLCEKWSQKIFLLSPVVSFPPSFARTSRETSGYEAVPSPFAGRSWAVRGNGVVHIAPFSSYYRRMSHSQFLRKEDSDLIVRLSVKVSFQSQGAYDWMYFFWDCEIFNGYREEAQFEVRKFLFRT